MGIVREPVTGWRVYGVSNPGLLTSNNNVVMPRERAESFCAGRPWDRDWDPSMRCLSGPGVNCTCGFYCFHELGDVETNYLAPQVGVLAEVYFWGTVHRYKLGLRAQYCYPKRLWTVGTLADACRAYIARQYGVPVGRLELDFPEMHARVTKRYERMHADRPEPPTEAQLYDRILMGDDEATRILGKRLASAICTRRKSIKRQEEQLARTRVELAMKIAQRAELRRAR